MYVSKQQSSVVSKHHNKSTNMILRSARRQNQKFEINVEAPPITQLQVHKNDQQIIATTANYW